MKTPEIVLESLITKTIQSKTIRSAAVLLSIAGMVFCAILLLPPVQNAIFELAGVLRGKELSKDRFDALLSLPFTGFALCAFIFCGLFSKQLIAVLDAPQHQKKYAVMLSAVALLLLVYNTVFIYRYGHQWLDSDASSEMVLAKLLAGENTLVSKNWHYSTEIRLVYQTIFTMPLFKLLGSTGNWALIRTLGIFFNSIVLILSYLYMMQPLKIKNVYVFITALFLIVPVSGVYWHIIIFGGYYTFFLAQMFCCLGLFQRLIDKSSEPKPQHFIINFVMFSVLSLVLGIQGIRSLLSISIPLLIVCIFSIYMRITTRKIIPALGMYGFLLCGVGFALSYLLRFVFSFHTFEKMRFEKLADSLFTKTEQCLAAIAGFLGMIPGHSLMSTRGLFGLLSLAAAVVLIWFAVHVVRRGSGQKCIPLFFLAAAIFNIFIFIIVDNKVAPRYFIPFMIFYIPITAIGFTKSEKIFGHIKRAATFSAALIFVFGTAFLNYKDFAKTDNNAARKGYIAYLLENHLDYGFATFWHANVTTELSNGAIKLAGLEPGSLDPGRNDFRLQGWLNANKLYNKGYHEGESFLLLTKDELKKAQASGRAFAQNTPSYEDNDFIVMRFPSAQFIHEYVLDP